MPRLPFSFLFVLFIIAGMEVSGQSIIRSSLSCLGSSSSLDGMIIRQTTGQPSNTMVFNNGGLALCQGFQQPLNMLPVKSDRIYLNFSLSPNPAHGNTRLRMDEQIEECTISITTIQGLLVYNKNLRNTRETWIDLRNYTPGIYIITVTSGAQTGNKKLIVSEK